MQREFISFVLDESGEFDIVGTANDGALAVVSKPPAFGSPGFDRMAGQLVRIVRLMSEVKVVRRWPARPRLNAPSPPGEIANPATFLIVQHMSEGFIAGFASNQSIGSSGTSPVRRYVPHSRPWNSS